MIHNRFPITEQNKQTYQREELLYICDISIIREYSNCV